MLKNSLFWAILTGTVAVVDFYNGQYILGSMMTLVFGFDVYLLIKENK